MKAVKTIIFATGILLAGGAYAHGVQHEMPTTQYQFNNDVEQPDSTIVPFQHPKTRAEVVQAFQSARAAGLIWQGESDNHIPAAGLTSEVPRAQVLKELAEARAAGQLREGELNYVVAS
ncbi:DUF4148 domain-containing protein [Alcaligenaceae bacterium]|nr:DUF4148 domain-containing protein [Alcaligenaceae bacterium]